MINEFSKTLEDDDRSVASADDSHSSNGSTNDNIHGKRRRTANVLNNFKDDAEQFCAIKGLLVTLFVLTNISVAVVAFVFARNNQQADFEAKFMVYAVTVADFSVTNTRQTFRQMELVGAEFTSNALITQSEWPLITMPYFDRSLATLMNITHADLIDFSPIVTKDSRTSWEQYVSDMSAGFVPAGIHNLEGPIPADAEGPFVPIWQVTPKPTDKEDASKIVNFDCQSFPFFSRGFATLLKISSGQHTIITEATDSDVLQAWLGVRNSSATQAKANANANGNDNDNDDDDDDTLNVDDEPRSFLIHPIYRDFDEGSAVVGTLTALLRLRYLFTGTLDSQVSGLVTVLRDSCGMNYTYQLDGGANVIYLGNTDQHNSAFDNLAMSVPLTERIYGSDEVMLNCAYTLDIYPSEEFEDSFYTNEPWLYAGVVLGMFCFTGFLLLYYNITIKKRQDLLMDQALKTTNILSSLFPTNVHERLFGRQAKKGDKKELADQVRKRVNSHVREDISRMVTRRSSDATHEDEIVDGMYTTKPIADLFPHTTIMFADIVGFTAWSSEREPAHVFTLLETIFRVFDRIANRMDVFKVETIGDCYVAVAGLPRARNDHAVIMAAFAKECMVKMISLVHRMEVSLGPDTGDLSMRFGLHSGPVTAGVLRGEKSRFQLFGDSVNTAARIETTGERGKIHISHETAELLITAGHSKWLVPRRDLVTAKGKGVMRTYWLVQPDDCAKSTGELSDGDDSEAEAEEGALFKTDPNLQGQSKDSKDAWGAGAVGVKSYNRLVEWNVDVLYQLLLKIVSNREASLCAKTYKPATELDLRFGLASFQTEEKKQDTASPGEIDPQVKEQLHSYVTLIASMYRDHPFHNFEHASHVMLSITKLMSRITTTPNEEISQENGLDAEKNQIMLESKINGLLHTNTYGIASDPLLQFSVAFSALIHDVDHAGVPNTQLVQEDTNLAKKYRFKSVAEKHSIRLAWERLMDTDYRKLRSCLCPRQNDLKRFRNFVVNTVMATDIADKELNTKRKERWRHCFDEWLDDPTDADVQRKATIVIEHLIQASDVAHTMQHFHVFLKWNERLFYEVYGAFDSGRAENDPSEKWYDGEIGFFDFYIIPLAKKLGVCGVFGVSSDEYLQYAQENRQKWKTEGKAVVEKWIVKFHEKKSAKEEAMEKSEL